jgi:hypothetical protein
VRSPGIAEKLRSDSTGVPLYALEMFSTTRIGELALLATAGFLIDRVGSDMA